MKDRPLIALTPLFVMRLPAVFLSHGAPTLAVEEGSERARGPSSRGSCRGRDSILAVSAHWDTRRAGGERGARPETIHDFFGFPRELYEQRYPPPGAPALAGEVARSCTSRASHCAIDPARGLDHGAWVPLKWMYPEADIPGHAALGAIAARHRAPSDAWAARIAALRDESVLVLASGGIVHNLRDLEWHAEGHARGEQLGARLQRVDRRPRGGRQRGRARRVPRHGPQARCAATPPRSISIRSSWAWAPGHARASPSARVRPGLAGNGRLRIQRTLSSL